MSEELTYPHDYRVIAGTDIKPTIIGGQAVNIWAITFLTDKDNAAVAATAYGSGDLDILSGPKVLDFLKSLEPDWRVDKIPMKFFGDGRDAVAHGVAPDGRKLLVEVLKDVKGLDRQDLAATDDVVMAGTVYRVLDPVALLKAKAANVLGLDQIGPPPRHDVPHLRLVAQCVPMYLRQAHEFAVQNPDAARAAADTFSRAFDALTNKATRAGLAKAGIDPVSIMPPELAQSPIDRIRNAYSHQLRRVRDPAAKATP